MSQPGEKQPPDNGQLQKLLTVWKLPHLISHLQDEHITVEVLKMLKMNHIPLLLQDFPLGDRIRFEFHVEEWRRSIGKPLLTTYSETPMATTSSRNVIYPPVAGTNPTKNTNNFVARRSYNTATQAPELRSARTLNGGQFKETDPNIHFDEIISQPTIAQVRSYYVKHGFLQPSHRSILINMVATFFYERNIHLTMQMTHQLEERIIKEFPNENITDYYVGERSRIYKRMANIKHYNRKYKRCRSWDTLAGQSAKRPVNSIDYYEPVVEAIEQQSWSAVSVKEEQEEHEQDDAEQSIEQQLIN